jgi:hypothetical protein
MFGYFYGLKNKMTGSVTKIAREQYVVSKEEAHYGRLKCEWFA